MKKVIVNEGNFAFRVADFVIVEYAQAKGLEYGYDDKRDSAYVEKDGIRYFASGSSDTMLVELSDLRDDPVLVGIVENCSTPEHFYCETDDDNNIILTTRGYDNLVVKEIPDNCNYRIVRETNDIDFNVFPDEYEDWEVLEVI